MGLLDGIELVVFDKDGTLIDFDAMWSPWVVELARRLESAAGVPVASRLFSELGFDPIADRTIAGSPLAILPMAVLRGAVRDVVLRAGVNANEATAAVDRAWFVPDPATEARALTDLPRLFASLRAAGRRIAVTTSDDHEPTRLTLAALGVADLVDVLVAADDGLARKPAPDMVLRAAAAVGVAPSRTAVVGDSLADLEMGRAAGAGRMIGVLSGVSAREDLEPFADAVVNSVADLAG
jgi:phosphoglycolate phosphatase-like HAD superfamily hydrolase